MRVLLLESCNTNISSAKEYGDIVQVFVRQRPSIWTVGFVDALLARLNELKYNVDEDYFLVVGPQVPITMAIATLVKHYKTPRLLFWDAVRKHYTTWSIPNAV